MKVYLATSGEYSDFQVLHVFTRREDAEAYPLADGVDEYDLLDGPVDVRPLHFLAWLPGEPDCELTDDRAANPREEHSLQDFDGNDLRCEHWWGATYDSKTRGTVPILYVRGWDLDRVREEYSEQRAQYIANRDAGTAP